MQQQRALSPRYIYVGDLQAPLIWDAVLDGGGEPTTNIEEATAIVWTGGDPDELAARLHDGIEWLQLPAAGIEKYAARGLLDGTHVTTNAGPAYAATVAEHALALLLASARRLHQLSRRTSWSVPEINQLRGSTVAIIGCGRIGEALITLLEPFEVEVLASTRSGRAVPGASKVVTPDRHHEILARSDYVVIAAPATGETMKLIGTPEFERMQSRAFLVNISRGSLVDTEALVNAIRTGSIAGAALDVTDPEPLPDGHPLWNMDEILVTPHIANPDAWDAKQLSSLVRTNVERFHGGQPLMARVDPTLGY